jgi:hypothetical protein
VQIHSTPGLGNAIGALYQAKRGHSPLVVFGGDAGVKYQAMDAQMAGDLVAMAEPMSKMWSWRVMCTATWLASGMDNRAGINRRVAARQVKKGAGPFGSVSRGATVPDENHEQPEYTHQGREYASTAKVALFKS